MKYIFFVSLFYNCPCLVKGEASFSVFVKKKLLTFMLNWLSMNAIMKGLKVGGVTKVCLLPPAFVSMAHELHDGGWIFSQKRGLTDN